VTFFLFASCNAFEEKANQILPNEKQQSYNIVPTKVTGLGRVEPEEKIIQIHPKIEGFIESVHVKMGDTIQKGQILFVIEHKMVGAKKAVIQAQIKEQEATIRHLQISLQKNQNTAENSQKIYNRIKEVFEQGAGTKQDLDNAETAWKTILFDLDAIKVQIDKAEAHLDELAAKIRMEEIAKKQYFVKAPSNGIILDLNAAKGLMVGQKVSLAEFAPESPTSVLTEIDELFAARVKLNQPAFIRLLGGRDTIAFGRVISLSPSLNRKSLFSEEIGKLEDRRVRKVRIRLEEGQQNVLYGQRVECLINVKN
jgi:multidrug resistance efflux pump